MSNNSFNEDYSFKLGLKNLLKDKNVDIDTFNLSRINKYFKLLNILYDSVEEWFDGDKSVEIYSDDIELKEKDLQPYTACTLELKFNNLDNFILRFIPLGFRNKVGNGCIILKNDLNDKVKYLYYIVGGNVIDTIKEGTYKDPETGEEKTGKIPTRIYNDSWFISSEYNDLSRVNIFDKKTLLETIKELNIKEEEKI